MNNLENKSNSPPCRYIKAKNSFGLLEGAENWSGIEDPNATYWCNKSAGPVGPDNGIVGPGTCIDGRRCFLALD